MPHPPSSPVWTDLADLPVRGLIARPMVQGLSVTITGDYPPPRQLRNESVLTYGVEHDALVCRAANERLERVLREYRVDDDVGERGAR
jgi:hypothetical protein